MAAGNRRARLRTSIYVAGRSREKQCAVTGEAVPSLVEQIVKAVRGKK